MKEGANKMEEIMKMVMSIDQKASDIMKKTQEHLETREKDIKNKIECMRTEIIDKTKCEAKTLYETTVKEAEMEAERIKEKTKTECGVIEGKFLKMKEKLEEQLFSRIFN